MFHFWVYLTFLLFRSLRECEGLHILANNYIFIHCFHYLRLTDQGKLDSGSFYSLSTIVCVLLSHPIFILLAEVVTFLTIPNDMTAS